MTRGNGSRGVIGRVRIGVGVGLALCVLAPALVLAAPANDDCTGAIVIPTGSFPYVTAPVSIVDATPQASVDPVLSVNTERTIWYQITPAVTGFYCLSRTGGCSSTSSSD